MNTFLIKNKNASSAVLLVILLLATLLLPTSLHAYWSIEGLATNNTFQIGSLDTTVSDSDLNASLSRSSGDTVQFTIADSGTLDGVETIHKIEAAPDTCAPSFYQGIDVILDIASNTIYDSSLSGLNATSTTDGTVELELETNSNLQAAENETCEVTITLDSHQTHFADNTHGFSDSHTISLTITAGEAIGPQPTSNVVLNEIYPATLSTTTVPLEREWVELYNGTSGDIDVNGYAISEISGTNEVLYEIVANCPAVNSNDYVTPLDSTNTTISSGGYLVLEFCGNSSYLNDGGDTVSLYDGNSTSTANQLDTHTYPSTTNGKSHQRIPDGGTWVDPIPTPGMPNDATREDLEAENWDEEEIDKVLKTLDLVKTEVDEVDPAKDGDSANEADPESDDSAKDTERPEEPIRDEENDDICEEECEKDKDLDEEDPVKSDDSDNDDKDNEDLEKDEDSDESSSNEAGEKQENTGEDSDDEGKADESDTDEVEEEDVDDLVKPDDLEKSSDNEVVEKDMEENSDEEKQDEKSDNGADPVKTEVDEVDPVKAEVNEADPVKSDDSKESQDNGADPVKDKSSDETLSNGADPVKTNDSGESPVNGAEGNTN